MTDQSINVQVTIKQADGYPGVAVYRKKDDPQPTAEIKNGQVIMTETDDGMWYGFYRSFGGERGFWYLKKRNTQIYRPPTPEPIDFDLPGEAPVLPGCAHQ